MVKACLKLWQLTHLKKQHLGVGKMAHVLLYLEKEISALFAVRIGCFNCIDKNS